MVYRFSQDELIARRARLRPRECDESEHCWVRDGPREYNRSGTSGFSVGCHGRISGRINKHHCDAHADNTKPAVVT